jgi:hypothetical protein
VKIPFNFRIQVGEIARLVATCGESCMGFICIERDAGSSKTFNLDEAISEFNARALYLLFPVDCFLVRSLGKLLWLSDLAH